MATRSKWSTSHLKVGWLQRNGVAHSDRATMTERFIRHGNYLTVVTIVDDPIYLEEPFIRTTNWVLNPDQEIRRTQFDVVDEVAVRRRRAKCRTTCRDRLTRRAS